MVLEESRVLYLDPKAASRRLAFLGSQEETGFLRKPGGGSLFHTGQSLSIGALKACLHNDTHPPTKPHPSPIRPHLLIVPLLGPAYSIYHIVKSFNSDDLLPPNRHYIIIFHSAIYSSIDKFIDTTMPVTLQSSTT